MYQFLKAYRLTYCTRNVNFLERLIFFISKYFMDTAMILHQAFINPINHGRIKLLSWKP